jgi:hypothetical protein
LKFIVSFQKETYIFFSKRVAIKLKILIETCDIIFREFLLNKSYNIGAIEKMFSKNDSRQINKQNFLKIIYLGKISNKII